MHSRFSDGDLSPTELVLQIASRGISGFSLTDHNGVWGLDEAHVAAQRAGVAFIEGIELSARWRMLDVHVLGYSSKFDREVLRVGLAKTRAGYRQRARDMIRLCHQAGFKRVSFTSLERRRLGQVDPVYASYDVARELTQRYGLSIEEARQLTTAGGACHVPYGDWAFSLRSATQLLQRAGGLAVLAHGGLIARDLGMASLLDLILDFKRVRGDGLEVRYPYHDTAVIEALVATARQHDLVITGGSDWHGPGRYVASDDAFGEVGLTEDEWRAVLGALSSAST